MSWSTFAGSTGSYASQLKALRSASQPTAQIIHGNSVSILSGGKILKLLTVTACSFCTCHHPNSPRFHHFIALIEKMVDKIKVIPIICRYFDTPVCLSATAWPVARR
jgi:hypothetical protein